MRCVGGIRNGTDRLRGFIISAFGFHEIRAGWCSVISRLRYISRDPSPVGLARHVNLMLLSSLTWQRSLSDMCGRQTRECHVRWKTLDVLSCWCPEVESFAGHSRVRRDFLHYTVEIGSIGSMHKPLMCDCVTLWLSF